MSVLPSPLPARCAVALLLGLALALTSLPAHAQVTDASNDLLVPGRGPRGKHCLGDQRTRLTARQHLVAQYNSTGAEHHARLGVCLPLITEPGLLFDLTYVEVGLLSYLTPAFLQLGGYVEMVPVAPLVLRAELSGVGYWALPEFNRAGYVPRSDYQDTFDNSLLGPELSEAALGYNLNLIAIPRLRVPVAPHWALIALSQLQFEFWDVGQADYYVNLRRDVLAAQQDWFVTNEAIALAEWVMDADFALRFGVYDSWRTVLGSGYTANVLGAMLMGNWPRPSEHTHDLSLFVRAGIYTDHDFRQGQPTVLAGVFVSNSLFDF